MIWEAPYSGQTRTKKKFAWYRSLRRMVAVLLCHRAVYIFQSPYWDERYFSFTDKGLETAKKFLENTNA